MTTCPDRCHLHKYLHQQLRREEEQAIEAHVESCSACQKALEDLERGVPCLPGYEISHVVGEGGMGVVYLAYQSGLRREVAIKVLKWQGKDDQIARQRFVEEAHITSQLEHPGIVPVHGFDYLAEPDGRPYLVMKWIKGYKQIKDPTQIKSPTIASLLAERSDGDRQLARLLPLFAQACRAVAFAHEHQVIHRDLKPDNIMVGAHGEVLVMDWGLAKVLPSQSDPTSNEGNSPGTVIDTPWMGNRNWTKERLGTWCYMPPEQALNRADRQDKRSDVFSLGAILCEILTGLPPYVFPLLPGSEAELRFVHEVELGVLESAHARLDACGAGPELINLAKKCLQKNREDRPADAREVAQVVTAYLTGLEEKRQQAERDKAAADARAEEAEQTRREALARLEAERRVRIRDRFLAFTVLIVLTLAGGGIWWEMERRSETNQSVEPMLASAAGLLKRGRTAQRPEQVVELIQEATLTALNAEDLAQSGFASSALRDRSRQVRDEAERELEEAKKDQQLLTKLLDISGPPELLAFQNRGEDVLMPITATLSEEQQFAMAWSEWGLDFDRVPAEEIVARLKTRPGAVVREIVSALDEQMLMLRLKKSAGWQRFLELANQLDENERQRGLRNALALDAPAKERAKQQLTEIARSMDFSSEPVSGIAFTSKMLILNEDVQGAEDLLRKALVVRPGEPLLLDGLGRLLARQKPPRLAEALEYFRAVRAIHRESGVSLAQTLLMAGRVVEANEVIRELLKGSPNHPALHYLLGTILMKQEKFNEASAACRKAIALKPDWAQAYNNLGVALRKLVKFDEAAAACRKAIALKPDYAMAYSNLGNVLLDLKQFDAAADACRKATELKPDDAIAHNNLGIALRSLKRFDEAAAAFRKATELQPAWPLVYGSYGNVLFDLRKFDEAADTYRKAIALKPTWAEAYGNLGIALRNLKRFDEAVAAYCKATELKPDFAEAYSNLGNVLCDLKQFDEAVSAHRKAIKLKPDFAEAHNNLGNVLRDLKKFREAADSHRKATELKPDFAIAHNNLGTDLCSLEEFDEAIAAFRKAIELKPDWAEAHRNLGNAYYSLKQYKDAAAAWRQAVQLRPDDHAIQNNLRQVERLLDPGKP